MVARLALFMLVLAVTLQAGPAAIPSSAKPSQPKEESWIKKQGKYLIAGGAVLAAGGILLAYLSSISTDTQDKPAPPPLGNPPQDPVIQGSP